MVFITTEGYKNAGVHIITIKNKDHFWVKMKDVQNGLGIKNMCNSLKKTMRSIFETKSLTKKQKQTVCKIKK